MRCVGIETEPGISPESLDDRSLDEHHVRLPNRCNEAPRDGGHVSL